MGIDFILCFIATILDSAYSNTSFSDFNKYSAINPAKTYKILFTSKLEYFSLKEEIKDLKENLNLNKDIISSMFKDMKDKKKISYSNVLQKLSQENINIKNKFKEKEHQIVILENDTEHYLNLIRQNELLDIIYKEKKRNFVDRNNWPKKTTN